MKILATFTDAGWDFNNIWEMPENDYPFLKWQIRNSPPADLKATALLSIAENQPVGMVIGEFNATDPDGDAITYHFVDGETTIPSLPSIPTAPSKPPLLLITKAMPRATPSPYRQRTN